jgi:ABC-type transport system involved in multi-copper enzyme maturation permease subunit
VIDRTLKSTAWRSLGYFVVLEAMLVVAILFWPDFERGMPFFKSIKSLPLVKDMMGPIEAAGVQGYVIVQHFFKGCNTLGTAAAVLFAMGAVAGEVQRGTLEIWLARPLSRRRILLERWLAGAAALTWPIFAVALTAPWLLGRVDETIPLWPLVLSSVHQTLFLLAIYAATFFFSTVGRNPTSIALGMLFFTTFEFSLYMVKTLSKASIFRLSDVDVYMRVFRTRALDPGLWPWLVLFTLVMLGASLLAFERRVP